MKKAIKLLVFYIFQIFLFSPISFAIGEKELDKVDENTNILLSLFSTDFLLNIVFVIFIFILTIFISKIITTKLSNYLERTDWLKWQNKDELIWVLTRTTNIIVLSIGFLSILSVLWLDVGILMWWIWFWLGFTLKIFLTNFVAWILMVTQWFYHNEDLIKVSWNIWKIKQIHALFTSVEQFDGVIFYIPNVKFLEDIVENFHTNNKRRVEVEVWTDYDTDTLKAKKIMLSVLWNFTNILKAPYPEVVVTKLWDSGISLCLRFWIDSKDNTYFDTKSNVTETINLAFKQHGIIIPYNQITISNRKENKK